MLRPMTILASLTRRQGSSINVPLRGTPLTPLRLAELEVCFEPHKNPLDNADDVIMGLNVVEHGNPCVFHRNERNFASAEVYPRDHRVPTRPKPSKKLGRASRQRMYDSWR